MNVARVRSRSAAPALTAEQQAQHEATVGFAADILRAAEDERGALDDKQRTALLYGEFDLSPMELARVVGALRRGCW